LVIFNIIISGFGYQVIDYFEKKDKPLFFSPQFILLPISLKDWNTLTESAVSSKTVKGFKAAISRD
jgi:hypothetical protein